MVTREIEIAASSSTINWANKYLELNLTEISRVIGVSRRTLTRWRNEKNVPSQRHRERIEKIRVLRHLLDRVFENRQAALEWLHSSVPMLRGRSPASLLREGRIDEVIEVLAGFESGAFI